uniref:Polyadenylate-binding protein n=1 Tax=Leersia perrieri TaxID=77586 RepID=A0A0D9WRM6_9ORYZ
MAIPTSSSLADQPPASSSAAAPDQPPPPAAGVVVAAADQTAEEAAVGAPGVADQSTAAVVSTAALYVGDLEGSVGEDQLVALFSQVVPVASAHVCRDIAATRAMEVLNFTIVNGKPIRVMFSNRDPTLRKSGHANIFIKNLEPSIDNKNLWLLMSTVILKGHGFVQFEREESANDAINGLNGMLVNGTNIFVSLFMRRQERENVGDADNFTHVYVKNLPKNFTNDDLQSEFAPFGAITSAVVMRYDNGLSKSFGFVNFEKSDSAKNVISNLDGKSIDGMVLYVRRAQKKSERQAELKQNMTWNLYDDINDEHLRRLFECFGEIASCKVMLDSHGRSKGYGFVSFAALEDANNAISKMNGKMVGKKPLYVGIHQSKEERKAFLAAHFARAKALATMAPTLGPNMVPHPFNFGHGVPALAPPPPVGYGFQPNFVPGIGLHAPNMMMPYNMQRHPSQRNGARHGGMHRQMHYPQMFHHPNANQGFRQHLTNRRSGLVNQAMLHYGFSTPMPPIQQDFKHFQRTDEFHAQSIPRNKLAASLASANPEQQREILGEFLFPLVEQLEKDCATKVTGMLLELDKSEVLNLIESPDTLRETVAAAMKVLELEAKAALGSGDAVPAAPSSSKAA